MQKKMQTLKNVSNVGYLIACIALFCIAMWIICASIWKIITQSISHPLDIYQVLDEVGLLVFAIAVIDVSKYLMIEEVFKGEEKDPKESRDAFTKFATIISTALCLEGLVLTIEAAKTNMQQILYPMALLITGILLIVGLGVYQRLSSTPTK